MALSTMSPFWSLLYEQGTKGGPKREITKHIVLDDIFYANE